MHTAPFCGGRDHTAFVLTWGRLWSRCAGPASNAWHGCGTMAFSIRRVFIGPRGLRAGWRLLLFLAVGFAGQFALSSATDALAGRLGFNPGDDLSATTFLLQDLSTLLVT